MGQTDFCKFGDISLEFFPVIPSHRASGAQQSRTNPITVRASQPRVLYWGEMLDWVVRPTRILSNQLKIKQSGMVWGSDLQDTKAYLLYAVDRATNILPPQLWQRV